METKQIIIVGGKIKAEKTQTPNPKACQRGDMANGEKSETGQPSKLMEGLWKLQELHVLGNPHSLQAGKGVGSIMVSVTFFFLFCGLFSSGIVTDIPPNCPYLIFQWHSRHLERGLETRVPLWILPMFEGKM